MFKSLLAVAALVVSVSAHASDTFATAFQKQQLTQVQGVIKTFGLNWKVGEENNYKMNLGGFLNGSMKMYVREITADGVWMVQDVDLMIQKQKVEVLLDQATGQVKKMLVNGQEQQAPSSNPEIIDQRQERITVPAGTFDVIYVKMKDGDQESEMWVNPRDIPLSGMVKMAAQSPIGPVTTELVSFVKK